MSATANNAEAGWATAVAGMTMSDPIQADDGRGGRDALQALLAFSCIHQQAARRRKLNDAGVTAAPPQNEEFGLDEVLQLVAARALSITGADGVAIALANDDAIICRASQGRIAPDRGVRLDPKSGFSGACLQRGQTVRCDDSETDERVNAQACRLLGARSMIAVPLAAKRRVVGLIEAFSSEPYGFNDSDVRSLNLLGELILAAIRPEEEERLVESAEQIAVEGALPLMPAKIIVDEKFAPEPVLERVAAAEIAVEAATVPKQAPSIGPNLFPSVESEPEAQVELEAEKNGRRLSVILTVAALLLVASILGWADWWKIRHSQASLGATAPAASGLKPSETEATEPNAPADVNPPLKSGGITRVLGIRHFSSADSSTVVIDLEDQVPYEQQKLDNPARIYFDLHDTKMATGAEVESIAVDDAFLKRVRMAQPLTDVTRVVLETKGELGVSVKLDSKPYRLTIEVHKMSPNEIPATPVKPSPVIVAPPKKTSATVITAIPTDFRIVLDAGHGGWDLGTVGRKGLLEKDLVLDIVQRLGQLVESKLGAQVIYTRQDDSYLPLEMRAEVANLAKANLFLSVHANYSDLASARGVETYYTNTYSSLKARMADDGPALKDVNWTGVDIREKVTGSHRFASDVQHALYGGLAARNPDVRNRGVKEAQYIVLTGTQMPAVLAEVSFVSSPGDEDRLLSSEYRQQIAEALYRGVAKYHEESQHAKLASSKR
jgi:N-acetylmuramoyl-L-alanine amidase/putative methionine-R-sulfoxide reductase with GAF domain